MVFSSLLFLFGFLPTFFILYYLAPTKYRNYTALLASYIFYAWGAPKFAVVLLLASAIDFFLGQKIGSTQLPKKRRRGYLIVSLIINVGLLAVFKYANFVVGELQSLFNIFGLSSFHWTHIALPIGISFFTFQKISYVVDVYRGTVQPAKKFADYALYVALFPQLIAGPIVRYHDIAKQLTSRVHSVEKIFYGMYRFCLGLGKKVLIANAMGQTADYVFGLPAETLPFSVAWIGILAYAFQIYFDFSGYSDMAIGLGSMMGFRFLENFNMPYIARNFTEFWRRWHISLSNWMKEYLYIPLGGNRISKGRTYFNLWFVFLISGLWHGASWNFVIWGAYHGFFLMLDKMGALKLTERVPAFLAQAGTFIFVLFGWVFFRSETLSQSLQYIRSMLDVSIITSDIFPLFWIDIVPERTFFVFIAAILISFVPASRFVRHVLARLQQWSPYALRFTSAFTLSLVLLVLSTLSLANASFNPFIYFRF